MVFGETYLQQSIAASQSMAKSGTASLLGKKVEYWFLTKSLPGETTGVGGVEAVVMDQSKGEREGELIVKLAVFTNMPELYTLEESTAVCTMGYTLFDSTVPVLYEYDGRTYIHGVMERAGEVPDPEHRRYLKIVPKE